MKSVYTISQSFYDAEIVPGRAYTLVSRENINTGYETWHLREDNGNGIPGNMDSAIRRYHGWRGTTNNISVHAHGLRRVLEIKSDREALNGDRLIRVKLGPDEAPEQD